MNMIAICKFLSVFTPLAEFTGFKMKIVRLLKKIAGRASYVEYGGIRTYIDKKDSLCFSLMGEFERKEKEFFKKFISDDMITVDIGANIGYHTVILSKLSKRVYAFEPYPGNLKLLEKNIDYNRCGNVVYSDCAISDENGETAFYLSKENNGDHKLISSDGESIQVRTLMLDSALPCTPDFIKIDVQGAEIKVLEGAKEILKKDVVLMLEYDERSLIAGDINPSYYMNYIRNLGFNIYGIDDEGNLCEPVLLKKKAVNLICIKDESNFITKSL